jgi:hypothetical protein
MFAIIAYPLTITYKWYTIARIRCPAYFIQAAAADIETRIIDI